MARLLAPSPPGQVPMSRFEKGLPAIGRQFAFEEGAAGIEEMKVGRVDAESVAKVYGDQRDIMKPVQQTPAEGAKIQGSEKTCLSRRSGRKVRGCQGASGMA